MAGRHARHQEGWPAWRTPIPIALVPLAYSHDLQRASEMSGLSSTTTHPARRPADACRHLGALIAAAVQGASKQELLDDGFWHSGELGPEIGEVAGGSFKRKQPPEIRGHGYVVGSLEAALWALHRAEDLRDGAVLAVDLGEDADTTGDSLRPARGRTLRRAQDPTSMRETLAHHDLICDFADRLAELKL